MSNADKLDLLLAKLTKLEEQFAAPPIRTRYTIAQLAQIEGRSVKFFRKQIRLRKLKPLPGMRPYKFDAAEVERWRNGRKFV